MARMKKAEKARKDLLEEYKDVYGVGALGSFQSDINEQDLEAPITHSMLAYSLRDEEEVELILSWHYDEICEFVEDFLNEYNELFLNYLINKINKTNES